MKIARIPILTTLLVCLLLAFGANAQDLPPGVAAVPEGPERDALQERIDAALEEGEVNYYDTIIQPETNEALTAAFREYYGLPDSFDVNYSLFSTSNTVTRVDEEIGANRVNADIVSVASLPWLLEHIESGNIMRYDSPVYDDYAPMVERNLAQPGYFASAAYVFVPMWNPEMLDFEGSSWRDVFGAVEDGLMSIGDASNSTSYLMTYAGLRQVFDLEFFEEIAAMDPVFLVRSEQIARNLVTGEQLMAFSGMPTRAYQFSQQGADLDFMMPEEGVVLLPQSTFILEQAPNPNAAKLWVDFFLSETGQQILVEHEALISGRAGFESPLPEYAPPIDDLETIDVDWTTISPEDLEEYRAEYESIFKD